MPSDISLPPSARFCLLVKKTIHKVYIIQKYFVPLQKIMAVTGIIPERIGRCLAQTEWLCRTSPQHATN